MNAMHRLVLLVLFCWLPYLALIGWLLDPDIDSFDAAMQSLWKEWSQQWEELP